MSEPKQTPHSYYGRVASVAIETLTPARTNARTHSAYQVRQIAKSIERFGFLNPVLIDDANHIVAGHGRVAAAKLLGLKAIPTLRIEHLTDIEKRAYCIADNRLAEMAGWDREILASELQALVDLSFEVDLTGFGVTDIDLRLEEASERTGETRDEDAVPDPSAYAEIIKPGDVWLLGQHRLHCGDARDPESFSILLGKEKAQFIFTDPPYNVKIDRHTGGLGRIRHREFAMASGELSEQNFIDFLASAFVNLVDFSENGSIHDICMDWRHVFEMLVAGRAVYSELKNICIWNKTNAGMGSFYRSKHELVFVWKNGTAPHINNFELGQHGRSRTNVWDYAGATSFRADRMEELAMHPTVKPIALIADAIKDCSRHGDLVLDCFGGSGSVLMAAEKTGRRARLIEIDPAYCVTTILRWQKYTGKSAVCLNSQKLFDDLTQKPRA